MILMVAGAFGLAVNYVRYAKFHTGLWPAR